MSDELQRMGLKNDPIMELLESLPLEHPLRADAAMYYGVVCGYRLKAEEELLKVQPEQVEQYTREMLEPAGARLSTDEKTLMAGAIASFASWVRGELA